MHSLQTFTLCIQRLPPCSLTDLCSTLISAATDTTSGALARILHLLAQCPDVQGRLRKEVVDAFRTHGEELDYDGISALPYLDAVIRETLRV
jgi:cytochrome P450